MEKDPYQILQVIPTAEQEVIEAAYKGLARRYHPDVNSNPDAGERMKEINWAYEILRDPESRKRYDRKHQLKEEPSPSQSKTQKGKSTTGGSTAPSQPPPPPSRSSKEDPKESPEPFGLGFSVCQSCGAFGYTYPVTYHRVIGVVIMRLRKRIDAKLCASCNEKYFWQFSMITLIFGWWAVNSFFAPPFLLIANFIEYRKSAFIREKQNLSDVASGWKAAFFFLLLAGGVIFLVTWINGIPASNPPNESSSWDSPEAEKASVIYSDSPETREPFRWDSLAAEKASVIYTDATASQPTTISGLSTSDCRLWTEVSLEDVGKELCVRGIVLDQYTNNGVFYMTFSQEPADFYMVSYGDWYEGIQSSCVQSLGEIKQIGKSPIMVIDDKNLYECR